MKKSASHFSTLLLSPTEFKFSSQHFPSRSDNISRSPDELRQITVTLARKRTMGRPLRVVLPNRYYFITNRCQNGQFVMRPDDSSRMIILGVLARAVQKYEVEVVSFVFMSNHFHLICRFPCFNMGKFMSQLTGQLSSRLNDLRGRSGSLFPDRYHSQVLMGQQALLDKINYVVNNPVKDALVADAADWPGVTSFDAQLSGEKVVGRWYNGTKYHRMKQSDPETQPEDARETFAFRLTVPECIDGTNEKERRDTILTAVASDRDRIWSKRNDQPSNALGPAAVCATDWQKTKPLQPRAIWPEKKRLLCWCNEPDAEASSNAISQFYAEHAERSRRYRKAANRRKNGKDAEFPEGMYPPGEAVVSSSSRQPEKRSNSDKLSSRAA